MISLIGKKCGMTRVFEENGVSLPATVIKFEDNIVIQASEYENIQDVVIGSIDIKKNRVSKVVAGQFTKNSISPKKVLKGFKILKGQHNISIGQNLTVEMFSNIEYVDVSGITKGKGFAGTVKAHHFATQDATHGNSRSHRVPGSIGQRQTPGRVFKGKRMCKQLGNTQKTMQNLKVIKVDVDKSCLFVMGAIPGAPVLL